MAKLDFLDLKPLLSPRSVAVIGASKAGGLAGGYGGRFVSNLRDSGFSGKIYLVNPKYDHIGDMPCYPSIEAVPESVDLAAIIVSNRLVLQTLEQCARREVKAALLISAGFAEAGEEGRINQEAIRQFIQRHRLPVCGPNCVGIINTVDRAMIHAYLYLNPWPGNIGLVSQSGALAFASILSPALDRGISFSYVVSSGNEAGLESIDYMRYFIHDPHTQVICCCLEGFKEAKRFLSVADDALEAGKPILVLKVGRSALGSRSAISHTGAMTGSDEVYQAVFNQKGVIRVSDPDDLFEVASVFSKCKEPQGEGMAIVSTSGGMCSLLADKCEIYGLQLPPLSEKISKYLSQAEFLLVYGKPLNPLDIRGQGSLHLPEILQHFIEDDLYHIITVVLGMPAVGEESSLIAQDLIRISRTTEKPLIVLWVGNKLNVEGRFSEEDGFRLVERSNIPIFYSTQKYLQAVKAFITYHRFRKRWLNGRSANETEQLLGIDTVTARSYLEGKEGPLDELQSHCLLSLYGIPVPREKVVHNIEEAVVAAKDIGYPVALKAISKQLPHKTEAGALRLSIMDENSLRDAYTEVAKAVESSHPGIEICGMLVQEMVCGAREIIVGFSEDDQFGSVVTCGLGGIFVEVLRDVSRRVPPLTKDDAQDMIHELKSARILESFRGQPAADLLALLDVILRVGLMASNLGDRIGEMEINPLMVKKKGAGVCAVDALIILKPLKQGDE